MKAAVSALDEIVFIIILIIFAGIVIVIFLKSYFGGLTTRTIPSVNQSAPLPCNISVSIIGGTSTSCTVKVIAEGGTNGVIYKLYNSSSLMCEYIAGYTKCTETVVVPGSTTYTCNTTGASVNNQNISAGGYLSYPFHC